MSFYVCLLFLYDFSFFQSAIATRRTHLYLPHPTSTMSRAQTTHQNLSFGPKVYFFAFLFFVYFLFSLLSLLRPLASCVGKGLFYSILLSLPRPLCFAWGRFYYLFSLAFCMGWLDYIFLNYKYCLFYSLAWQGFWASFNCEQFHATRICPWLAQKNRKWRDVSSRSSPMIGLCDHLTCVCSVCIVRELKATVAWFECRKSKHKAHHNDHHNHNIYSFLANFKNLNLNAPTRSNNDRHHIYIHYTTLHIPNSLFTNIALNQKKT